MDLSRCRIPLKQALRQPMIRPPFAFPRLLLRAHHNSRAPLRLPRMPATIDTAMNAMNFLNFDEPPFDEQQFLSPEEPMLFDFDLNEGYPPGVTPGYDYTGRITDEMDIKPIFSLPPEATRPVMMYDLAPTYSPDSFHGSDLYHEEQHTGYPINNWFARETDTSPLSSPSSPIPIPSGPQSPSFFSFGEHSALTQDPPPSSFSPSALAAALPLPHSPPSSFEDQHQHQYSALSRQLDAPSLSVSPHETQTPAWASQLWDSPPPSAPRHLRTPSSPRSAAALRHSPLGRERRNSLTAAGYLFPSSSAPGASHAGGSGANTIRAYSQRAESFSTPDDRDATVRRANRRHSRGFTADEGTEFPVQDSAVAHESPPLKSMLRPPKLAPSAWQLYFTDWIQRQQASSSRKLNVAQAAKEAGQEYASLTEEEKEPYKRRSQAAKDVRERLHNEYMRTLTPEDIKRENAFRAAQRKAGKSRKSNIKDPNAPKKPLSAYFMFLQRIRASQELVREIFGDETETTKQSVLAAAKWRAMTDEERKPFLAQAEQEKMEYEAARRLYEDGSAGSAAYASSSFNFSILPGSPAFPAIKIESESESDGDGIFIHQHTPSR